MRLKVVDIYDLTGDLECLGEGEETWYTLSPTSVARVFGMDISQMSNDQVIEALRGKEFHARLAPMKYGVKHGATAATDERWKILDRDCEQCQSKYCDCASKEAARG